jgi:cytochrome c553
MKKILLSTIIGLMPLMANDIKTNDSKEDILYKCKMCHGYGFEKIALQKSKIVSDMDQKTIYNALIGYKNGTYGGPMKNLMNSMVKGKSETELLTISQDITKITHKNSIVIDTDTKYIKIDDYTKSPVSNEDVKKTNKSIFSF